MSKLYTQFDNVFFEKTRLSIITILYKEGKVSFKQLKERLGGSDGALYTHIEKLYKAGYLDKQKEIAGMQAQTVYRITAAGRKEFKAYLQFLEQMVLGGE